MSGNSAKWVNMQIAPQDIVYDYERGTTSVSRYSGGWWIFCFIRSFGAVFASDPCLRHHSNHRSSRKKETLIWTILENNWICVWGGGGGGGVIAVVVAAAAVTAVVVVDGDDDDDACTLSIMLVGVCLIIVCLSHLKTYFLCRKPWWIKTATECECKRN